MALPKIVNHHSTVTIDGEEFTIRSLTRAEVSQLQKMAAGDADGAELEVFLIAAGTDTPADETRTWYEHTPNHATEALVDAIRDLSKAGEGAQKSGGASAGAGGG